MISDKERIERKLQEEADKEKAKTKPQKIRVDGVEIDLQDRQTLLIGKTSIPPGGWDSGKTSISLPTWNRAASSSRTLPKEEGCELFWRIPRLFLLYFVNKSGQ